MLKGVSYRNEKLPRSSVGFITWQFVLKRVKNAILKEKESLWNQLFRICNTKRIMELFSAQKLAESKATVIKGILKLINSIHAYI